MRQAATVQMLQQAPREEDLAQLNPAHVAAYLRGVVQLHHLRLSLMDRTAFNQVVQILEGDQLKD
jgi:hypothetical protein